MAKKAPKKFNVNASWLKLLLAALLLNVIVLAGMLTGTPTVSPASAWATAVYRGVYKVRPVTNQTELAALHEAASKVSKEQCMACHGDMKSSKLRIHNLHLTSELLPGLACHDCHKKISLEKRSNLKVVRLVDVGVCKKCHSSFPGLDPNSPMKPSDFQADCTTCHSGKAAYRHESPYLSHVIAPRECAGCHGGRVLPWTPAHELDTWVRDHGQEALRVGSNSCMKCHEFGLAFCNDCHKQRPPSHQPRDVWLAQHPSVAKKDTRACFTCHQPEFCKRCHVNHTANWRTQHFKTVLRDGADGCMNCHSETFCSACHVAGGNLPVAPVGPLAVPPPAKEVTPTFETTLSPVTTAPAQ